MAQINGLGSFGQSQPPKIDPDKYAKEYAEKNNLSLADAKAKLKEQYGDPQQKDNKIGGNNDSLLNFNKSNSAQPTQKINPDDYAEVYAKINNITVEEAKTELKQKYGDPDKKTEGGKLNIMA